MYIYIPFQQGNLPGVITTQTASSLALATPTLTSHLPHAQPGAAAGGGLMASSGALQYNQHPHQPGLITSSQAQVMSTSQGGQMLTSQHQGQVQSKNEFVTCFGGLLFQT